MNETLIVIMHLAESFWLNCRLFLLTLLFAIPLGLVISFGSMSKFAPLSAFTKTAVWIVRGVPLMLLVIIIFFTPGLLGWGSPWGTSLYGRFNAAAVAFIINYACYFSEIFRGGIQGIPIGQTEAGQVLGMTKVQIFFRITFLQVIKRILPPMGNGVITLIKDTSLARIIATPEIIHIAQVNDAAKGIIWPLFSTALFFLVFVGALTLLFGWMEKKLDYFRA
jgi:polar amino acid transport system permease protein